MILLVEDDVFFSESVSYYLEAHGKVVLSAYGPDQAVELLNKNGKEITCAFLDVMMRRGKFFGEIETRGGWHTGLILGSYIKKEYQHIKVYGITASIDEKVREWFDKFGDGFIRKDPKYIEKTIVQMAEGKVPSKKRWPLDLIDLKPNFYGLGLNLNALTERLRKK